MAKDGGPLFFTDKVYLKCGLAVEKDGAYSCGVLCGRKCNGQLLGKGRKYKCETAGFEVEFLEPPVP